MLGPSTQLPFERRMSIPCCVGSMGLSTLTPRQERALASDSFPACCRVPTTSLLVHWQQVGKTRGVVNRPLMSFVKPQ